MSLASAEPGGLMDAIYIHQRHVYDATRKFYLLGRDALIDDLRVPPGGSVLEIGCGTGRNLVAVARRYPDARCFGLDVSSAMLSTARRSVARAGFADRIQLAMADASSFDAVGLFGEDSFDRVVISYVLSMIPPWREVLDRTACLLTSGGSLHLVDFGDGRNLPRAFNIVLGAWLARFHVTPRHDLAQVIATVARAHGLESRSCRRFGGYAVTSRLTRPLALSSSRRARPR